MKHISDLFARYKNQIKPPQKVVINEFIIEVKETLGFEIKSEQCSYSVSTKTLHLKTPSVIKSEIIRQKTTLINGLNKRLGKNSPNQII